MVEAKGLPVRAPVADGATPGSTHLARCRDCHARDRADPYGDVHRGQILPSILLDFLPYLFFDRCERPETQPEFLR